MHFTKENKKEINLACKKIVKELFDFFDMAGCSFEAGFYAEGSYIDYVAFGEDGIYLAFRGHEYRYGNPKTRTVYRSKSDAALTMDLDLIRNYPKLRVKILEEIAKLNQRQTKISEDIAKFNSYFDRNVTIDLSLPEASNLYELEVENRDGTTIGTINVGDATVRIITDDNIILTKRTELELGKQKQLLKR